MGYCSREVTHSDGTMANANTLVSLFTDAVCGGQAELAEYVLDWMAKSVQEPGIPQGTFLVFIGQEGLGKGVLH